MAEENSEMQTQINLFNEHREMDAEEFSHRYDNIRLLMEYLLRFVVIIGYNIGIVTIIGFMHAHLP